MRITPETLKKLGYGHLLTDKNIRQVDVELMRRDFYQFFKESWHVYDPAPLVDGWHLRMLCRFAQHLAERKIREGVICMPPAHCKSSIFAVAFGAWVWTHHPEAAFLISSYGEDLAIRDSVKMRRLVESDWYQQRFTNVRLRKDQNQKGYYETTAGGHRQITTPTSKTTGLRGDFLIVDDPHNVAEAESDAFREGAVSWWFESMASRYRDVTTGCKLVVQQRIHARDLAGVCIKRGYAKLVLPAQFEVDHPERSPDDPRVKDGEWLWPEKFPPSDMEKLRAEHGVYAWAGQYQQRPSPRIGGMFEAGNFQIIDALPIDDDITWVRAWDFAASTKHTQKADPDWTCGVKMGRGKSGLFYIADTQRLRQQAIDVERTVKNIASQDGADVRIRIPKDPGQAGKAQAEHYIRMLAGFMVLAEIESGDKATRAQSYAAQCQGNNVRLLRGAWNDAFIAEHVGFPNFDHDDQVDAASGAFRLITGQANTGMLDYLRTEYEAAEIERLKNMKLPQQGAPQP